MYQNEDLVKIGKLMQENIRKIKEMVNPYIELRRNIENSISRIAIPKIEFPKIEFPEIKIDYKKIEALANHNSSYGWTMTGEIDIRFYLDEYLLKLNQQQIDKVFLDYFESDSFANYQSTKSAIITEVDEKWKKVLKDCFELYENDKYQVIIPMLMTVIEGEVSDIAESPKVGGGLLNDWEKKILSDEERLMIIVSYSLNQYLSSKIFVRKEFHEDRAATINRNWVLHGRDNPENWTKIDALKLINVISTLQFIKEVKKM